MKIRTQLILFAVFISAVSWAVSQNSVARFFASAELQVETDRQCQEIKNALNDMLNSQPALLRTKRYSDYMNNAGLWDVIQLVNHYFVSNPPYPLTAEKFYADYRAKTARIEISRKLTRLGECAGHARD